MMSFEEVSFFAEGVLKICVVAEGYAQAGHAALAEVEEDWSGIVLEVSMAALE
jgi:hypothetical protein